MLTVVIVVDKNFSNDVLQLCFKNITITMANHFTINVIQPVLYYLFFCFRVIHGNDKGLLFLGATRGSAEHGTRVTCVQGLHVCKACPLNELAPWLQSVLTYKVIQYCVSEYN